MKGIKLVARMRNERALRVLMQISERDDNAEVRAFAKKGAAYVAKKIEEQQLLDEFAHEVEEIQAADEEADTPKEADEDDAHINEVVEFQDVVVTERQKDRAQGYVSSAFELNMSGQKEKAIKALAKAIKINPNLRFDQYFLGVATSVTGQSDEESVLTLYSDRRLKKYIASMGKQKAQQEVQSHLESVEQHTWGSLLFDLGVLSAIVFLGMFLTVLMVGYTSNVRIQNVTTQVEEQIEEAGSRGDLTEEAQTQIAEAEALLASLQEVPGIFGFSLASVMALSAWAAVVIGLLVFSGAAHLMARALGGEGTLPFLIYNIVRAYNTPMIIIFVVMMLGPILIFIVGMSPAAIPFVLMIMAGIITIIALAISFRVTNSIGRAYHFGYGKAYLTYSIAGIPSSIVVLVVGFLASLADRKSVV